MTGATTERIARQVGQRRRTAAYRAPCSTAIRRSFPAGSGSVSRWRGRCAVEPAVLLMDEPLSNLDALLRLEMRADLKTVLREAGTTTLYVTHDQTEAMGLADRIAVMYAGTYRAIAAPAEIYRHPASRFVAGFLGSPPMNFLTLPVAAGEVGSATCGFRRRTDRHAWCWACGRRTWSL